MMYVALQISPEYLAAAWRSSDTGSSIHAMPEGVMINPENHARRRHAGAEILEEKGTCEARRLWPAERKV